MRVVYYGRNVTGRTEQCRRIAEEFEKVHKIVVSNSKEVVSYANYRISPSKEEQLSHSDNLLYKAYRGESISKYAVYQYSPIVMYFIRRYIEYMVYEGDILILENIDSYIPKHILGDILRCLSENGGMFDCWEHVVVTGYSPYLMYLMKDLEGPIYFIENDDKISKITGCSDIEDKYLEIVYGKDI